MVRAPFRRRMRSLWKLELANGVAVFPLAYVLLRGRYDLGWFSLLALLVACSMLLVGAAMWYLQERRAAGSKVSVAGLQRALFRTSRLVFGIVLLVLVALSAGLAVLGVGIPTAELVVGGALLLLALLEYINYFFVQLMYDNASDIRYLLKHHRLKRAAMLRLLDG